MSKKPTDPFEKRHLQLLGAVEREIQKVYQHLHLSVGVMLDGHDFSNTDPKQFALINHPLLYHQIDRLTAQATKQVTAILRRAVMSSYIISTDKAQELVNTYFAGDEKKLTAQLLRRAEGATTFAGQWFEKHPISERVWNIVSGFREEVEERIKQDLINGTSSEQISRNIRSYLNEPKKLFRRVRGRDGNLHLSRNARAYHPGRGVYRSSYKNARRLAVTEVNNAYRQADNDRWQSLDFVVGIRVQLSNNHTYRDHKGRLRTLVDICDDLKGDYPKDFQFTSWHPHCRCIATPILKTREEMKRDSQLIREGKAPAPSKNEVKDLPQNFKTWQEKNAKRIERAAERGKLPHWYRDNQKLIEGAKAKTLTPTQIRAKERHEARTPEQIQAIQKRWLKRNRKICTEQAKEALIGRTASHPKMGADVNFTVKGIKEAINQPHSNQIEKNKAIKSAIQLIEKGQYVGKAIDEKGRNWIFHYININIKGIDSQIIIRQIGKKFEFYSITDKRKTK